jgi:hypothetical protein
LTAFSSMPIVLVLLLGLALAFGGVASAVALVALYVLAAAPVPSTALWLTALVLATGVNLTGVGTVGLYVAHIAKTVRGRPRVTIAESVGVNDA